ncbi:hypothetical protein [Methylotenera sp.]|uniref:hypothetical protein n=1 Tax=Methylotenera sp. TaxID=2051956 RepID=UPI0027201DE7|nr:hypothetical protein [Methylotenera sp.]MDO9206115.1 hypothetical protein [Methylotenera sp.]MDP3308945.1 hypothetical protein [Methylotenera sp.]MDP3818204.1 hypothetical protein [Methylotenera sp.]
MPKLYIDEFVGITNRLETLPLAFALKNAYGHSIILNWHELDSFSVEQTQTGKIGFWQKLGAERVRDCDEQKFKDLQHRNLVLRSLDGPLSLLDPIYMEVARKIHLKPSLAEVIKTSFAPYLQRPVVGVHVRHGDYHLENPDRYVVEGVEWPAIPVWWYEKVMAKIVVKQPDVCFLLSSTGDPNSYPSLRKNFDVFTINAPSPYGYKGADHHSEVNPVADLFALACTPVMLATPISGYSHWAANVLGAATTCIVPLENAIAENLLCGRVDLYGKRLPVWRKAGREGTDTTSLNVNLDGVDFSQGAQVDWL